jgi:hypothetical protein
LPICDALLKGQLSLFPPPPSFFRSEVRPSSYKYSLFVFALSLSLSRSSDIQPQSQRLLRLMHSYRCSGSGQSVVRFSHYHFHRLLWPAQQPSLCLQNRQSLACAHGSRCATHSARGSPRLRPSDAEPLARDWPAHLDHLDSCDVKRSSVDPVRFAEAGKEDVSVPHLWIGVMPGTLAFEAAKDCKDVLTREGFPDVEVAFRESVVTHLLAQSFSPSTPLSTPSPSFVAPSFPRLASRSLRSRHLTSRARVPSTSERAARATASSFSPPTTSLARLPRTVTSPYRTSAATRLVRRSSSLVPMPTPMPSIV